MSPTASRPPESPPQLSTRQRDVLRAAVRAYVGEAVPVGSELISHLLPAKLSPASIRATLAELGELGLLEQPHPSAGRVPSEAGLRYFIDCLLDSSAVAAYDRRSLDFEFDRADGDEVLGVVADQLSASTRLLGFALAPRLERLRLQHLTLVRLASGRVLAVLVSSAGSTHRRLIESPEGLCQRELDRLAALLNAHAAGSTLTQLRDTLRREARALRRQARQQLRLAVELAERALAEPAGEADLVLATRLALLEQPEYRDPRRIREILETLETKERLAEIVQDMLRESGVRVVLGSEVGDPALSHCAVVATHYGDAARPLGAVGVLGPSRMDYGRVIPLVAYCSRALTEKLQA